MLLSRVLAVVVASLTCVFGQASGDLFPFEVHEKKLGNGLTLLVIPTDHPDIVALQIPVQVGSRNEVEEGRSGFAHFFEHMMFRGTDRFSADAYNDVLKRAGADSNAYTTDDFTNYHTTFSKADLETVIELEADRFMNLNYSKPAFETEARAVLGEYNKNFADPINQLLEDQRNTAFSMHTYKHTTMGFIQDIERMPNMFDYSRTFFDRFYRPERTTVIVAGDVQAQNVFKLVEKHWGSWKRGTHQDDIAAEPQPTSAAYHHVPWPSPAQPWVAVGFHGPAASDTKPDMAAMSVMAGLAFGSSSEVYKRLVVEEQKVDQLFAYFPDQRDPYLMTVMARVKSKADIWYIRDQIQATFNGLRNQPVDAERLDAIKSNLRYSFASELDNSEAIAEALVPYVALYGDWSAINRVYGLYAKLDAKSVQEVAKRWFSDQRMVVSTVAHGALPPQKRPVGTTEGADAVSRGSWANEPVVQFLQPTQSPLIDIRIVFDTGSAVDDSKPGIANLTAAVLTRGGSSKQTYPEIQRALFPMAASFSAQVDKEMTTFIGRVHRDHAEEYWKIVGEQLLDPGWRKQDFERVRNNVVNEIRTDLRANNDEELAKEVLYEDIYDGHPYGHLSLGHVAALERMTVEDAKGHWQRHYGPRNVWLGLTGGFDSAFAKTVAEDLASKLSKASVDTRRLGRSPRTLQGHQVTIVKKDTRATALSFGFKIGVTRKHRDFTALWLARSWLGEHRSSNSHLFQRMREIRGMNYGDYAYVEYFPRGMSQFHPDAGLCRKQQIFQVWVRPVPPEQDVYAMRIAKYELDKLVDNGLTRDQFESTREFLAKYLAVLVKSQDRQLGYAMDSRWYGMKDFVGTMRDRLTTLTLENVNKAIKRHLTYDRLHIVFVTKNAEDLKSRLASGAPSPISYTSKKPQDILDEDKIIEHYPLAVDRRNVRIVDVSEVFEKR